MNARALALSVFALLWIATAGTLTAETPEELFDQGNRAYDANDYNGAVRAYETVTRYGIEDARVEYNLGNAYYKLGMLGPAILHYERARRLAPTDEDISDNLTLAQSRRFDRVESTEAQGVVAGMRRFQDRLGPDRHAVVALIVVWAVCGVLTWAGARPGGFNPRVGWTLAVLVLIGTAVGVSWITTYDRLVGEQRVVVLDPAVEVLAGPGENNASLFTVHEGLTMEVRGERGEWVQVSLPNGLNGWIRRAVVGFV